MMTEDISHLTSFVVHAWRDHAVARKRASRPRSALRPLERYLPTSRAFRAAGPLVHITTTLQTT